MRALHSSLCGNSMVIIEELALLHSVRHSAQEWETIIITFTITITWTWSCENDFVGFLFYLITVGKSNINKVLGLNLS